MTRQRSPAKKCLGTTVTLWLNLAGLYPLTPCHVSLSTWPHPQYHSFLPPTETPISTKSRASPLLSSVWGVGGQGKIQCSGEVHIFHLSWQTPTFDELIGKLKNSSTRFLQSTLIIQQIPSRTWDMPRPSAGWLSLSPLFVDLRYHEPAICWP